MTQDVVQAWRPRELSIVEALRVYCSYSRSPPLQAPADLCLCLPYIITYLALHVLSPQSKHPQRKLLIGWQYTIQYGLSLKKGYFLDFGQSAELPSSQALFLYYLVKGSHLLFSTKANCKMAVIQSHVLPQGYIYQLLEKKWSMRSFF